MSVVAAIFGGSISTVIIGAFMSAAAVYIAAITSNRGQAHAVATGATAALAAQANAQALQIANLQNAMANLQEEYHRQINELLEKVRVRESELDRVKTQLEFKEREVSQLNQELARLYRRVDELERRGDQRDNSQNQRDVRQDDRNTRQDLRDEKHDQT